ncbi:MAG TPA: DedA family protein [Pseudonocardiaceae bacterium]|nr:DedA family protein [Pseudonocardiaceae bacterium]
MQVILSAAAHHSTGGLTDLAVQLMDGLSRVFGGAGAAVANGLDSVFPFLPSEVILSLAGVSASHGHMTLVGAILWTTLGSMVGSTIMYYLGVWLGRERARALLAKIPLIRVDEVDRSEAWFRRHGAKAVFFGRMIPLFRSLISVPAGVERMSYPLFLLLTTLGSVVWNVVFVLCGYLLGRKWYLVDRYAGLVTTIVIGLVVVAVAYFVVSRLRKRRKERQREPTRTG